MVTRGRHVLNLHSGHMHSTLLQHPHLQDSEIITFYLQMTGAHIRESDYDAFCQLLQHSQTPQINPELVTGQAH